MVGTPSMAALSNAVPVPILMDPAFDATVTTSSKSSAEANVIDTLVVSLRIKNQDGKLEKVNQYENLNYRIIDDIFSQSTSDYKDLKVGDFWDLKFDKKLWDEDGILEPM